MSLCGIIRVKSFTSCLSGQNKDTCPSMYYEVYGLAKLAVLTSAGSSKIHNGILISLIFLKFLYQVDMKNWVKCWKYYLSFPRQYVITLNCLPIYLHVLFSEHPTYLRCCLGISRKKYPSYSCFICESTKNLFLISYYESSYYRYIERDKIGTLKYYFCNNSLLIRKVRNT